MSYVNSWLAASGGSSTPSSTQISPCSIPEYYQPFQNSQVAAVIPSSMMPSKSPAWSQSQERFSGTMRRRCGVITTEDLIARALARSRIGLRHCHRPAKAKNIGRGHGSGRGPNKKRRQAGFKIPRMNKKQPFFSASDSSSSSDGEENSDWDDDVVILEDLRKSPGISSAKKSIGAQAKANQRNGGVDVEKLPPQPNPGFGVDQGCQAKHCSGCDKLESTVARLKDQFDRMEIITSQLVESLNCLKIGVASVKAVPFHSTPAHDDIDLVDFVDETMDEEGFGGDSSQNQNHGDISWVGNGTPRPSGMVRIRFPTPDLNQLREECAQFPRTEISNVAADPNSLIPVPPPEPEPFSQCYVSPSPQSQQPSIAPPFAFPEDSLIAGSQQNKSDRPKKEHVVSPQSSIAPRFVFPKDFRFSDNTTSQQNNNGPMELIVVSTQKSSSSSVPAEKTNVSPDIALVTFAKKSHKKKVPQPQLPSEVAVAKKSHKKKVPQPQLPSEVAVAKKSHKTKVPPEEDFIYIFGSSSEDEEVVPYVSPQWKGSRSYLLNDIGTTTRRSARIASKRSATEH